MYKSYKTKQCLKKICYILKMVSILVIVLVVPMFLVFKYREYDYQKKQAKIIQDFLERKGMYAANASGVELESSIGYYIVDNNETNNDIIVESYNGYYLANENETNSSNVVISPTINEFEITPTIVPTPTPTIIENEYAIAQGDILTLSDEFKITYYCPCKKCCGNYSYEVTGVMNTTASGTTPIAGRTIAVCKDQIPLGTTVIIDGHEYIAEDTGGAIKWNRIDIYCDTHQEALNGGVKYATISIKR